MIKKIAIVSVIILITILLIYCTTDESTIIGPFGNAGNYLSVTGLTVDKATVYSNGETATVGIKLVNVNNSPVIGLKVDFTTEFGSITESDITDSSGIATAIFMSDETTGKNIITVDTGVKKYTLTIEVVSYQPRYIELFSESLVLLADGISSTTITAVLKDSVGNPMPEITVIFETDLGTLSSHVEQTNISGIAKTELTSTNYEGIATITATSFVASYIEVEFKKHVPVFVEISSDSTKLLADGISEAKIIAKAFDSANKDITISSLLIIK